MSHSDTTLTETDMARITAAIQTAGGKQQCLEHSGLVAEPEHLKTQTTALFDQASELHKLTKALSNSVIIGIQANGTCRYSIIILAIFSLQFFSSDKD